MQVISECEDCGRKQEDGEGDCFVMCNDDVLRCWACYVAHMRLDEDLAMMREWDRDGK